jgi:hypothetical protein
MANWNSITEGEMHLIETGEFTAKELSEKTGRHIETIRKYASSLGVKLPKPEKTYCICPNVFENLSPSKAYCLGFIAADGNVYFGKRNSGGLEISLSSRDESHLRKIRNILGTTAKIKISKTNFDTQRCRLQIGCRPLAENLANIGITPRKSHSLQFPVIDESLVSHFIRGYFDGDGYIRIKKNGNLEVSMLGTEDFLLSVKNFFTEVHGIEVGSLRPSQSQYRLAYSGVHVPISFGKWMYSNSCQENRLDRKYDLFHPFMNSKTSARYSVPMGRGN